ncbi:MAG: transcription antitermination factor NusB [Candidatus Kapaibacterium sp.]
MSIDITSPFPLSQDSRVKGTRRLAREKTLQVITAYEAGGSDLDLIFNHIFFREFNFGDGEEKIEKLLTPAEVLELESDVPIQWKKEEVEFASELLRKSIDNKDSIDTIIDKFTANWELDRIALIDRLLLRLAIAELLYFEEIPTKVSINEAIEISKNYSTDKSSNFINGVLDSVLDDLKKTGQLRKTGRGLIET